MSGFVAGFWSVVLVLGDKPGGEGFVVDGDDPDLAELGVVKVSDRGPGDFDLWVGFTYSDVALKSVDF